MGIKIALAGNPNCGKTTLFNDLTGSTQYVGNWPGVTVEKKEGRLKGHKDVIIQDLPGIYSLSPYTLEEVVTRNYLVNDKPDVILNIIDGTNIERNLYLTTQLVEIGLPMVIAVNMMDLVRKNGDTIDIKALGEKLGCKVIEISAMKGEGTKKAAELAIAAAEEGKKTELPHVFDGSVEHAIAHIEESIQDKVDNTYLRWFAVKLFERDAKATDQLHLDKDLAAHIEQHIVDCEKELDDDAESIITNQRYVYIQSLVKATVDKKVKAGELSTSDKIDKIVTNRVLALPIFFLIMWLIYDITCGSHVWSIGTYLTDWTNDVLFGEVVPNAVTAFLTSINSPKIVTTLIVDGIIGGVGTVLGFVPQMAVLFLFVSFLEDSGYMARIAFIMDRIFRRFGLSGKSFIPMLVGTGCGVPAIMASRTIENDKDRKMTIMLATYLPCGAKMTLVVLMSETFFPGNSLVPTSMYFIGLAIVVLAGIALKKTRWFAGDPAPFVMELPAYHLPSFKGVLIHVWERVKAYAIKAGTIIFVTCVILWFLMNFNLSGYTGNIQDCLLKSIGEALCFIFAPLGFGNWQGTVAAVSSELAKEQATATLGLLGNALSEEDEAVMDAIGKMFSSNMAGLSFMLFNVFDAPCLVAIATAFREFGEKKWGWFCFAFQMCIGYCLALVAYQIGMVANGGGFNAGTVVAIAIIVAALYFIFRKAPNHEVKENVRAVDAKN